MYLSLIFFHRLYLTRMASKEIFIDTLALSILEFQCLITRSDILRVATIRMIFLQEIFATIRGDFYGVDTLGMACPMS